MLGILINRNGDEVTLRCRGDVVAGRPVDILRLAAEMRKEMTVVLDLVQVRSVDAAGLGLLVELHHSFKSAGRQFKLARVSSRVAKTLRLVKLDRLFNMPNGHAAAA